MKFKIILAPLLFAAMMDYTVTLCSQTLQEKQELFAYSAAKLIIHIFESGYKCTLGEAFRTHEQALIYSKEHLGIVNSKHCQRLALDINLFDSTGKYIFADDKEYEALGHYWESLNPSNRWGGLFHRHDLDHFEMD